MVLVMIMMIRIRNNDYENALELDNTDEMVVTTYYIYYIMMFFVFS